MLISPTRYIFLVILALIIISPGYANEAEERIGHWKLGAHVALAIPGGRVNDLQEPGLMAQSSVEYFFHKRVSLGFEGGFSSHRLAGDLELDVDGDALKDFVQVGSGESFHFIQLTPFIKIGKSSDYGIDGVRWFRSYVILGAGLYHVYNRSGMYVVEKGVGTTGMDLRESRIPIRSQIHNYVGINFGYGFGVQIWTHYRVGLDLRYHRLFDKPKDADYWVPSFRFSRLF